MHTESPRDPWLSVPAVRLVGVLSHDRLEPLLGDVVDLGEEADLAGEEADLPGEDIDVDLGDEEADLVREVADFSEDFTRDGESFLIGLLLSCGVPDHEDSSYGSKCSA